MKTTIQSLIVLSFLVNTAGAYAQATSHGGNDCERRFKHYAANIRNWILNGGSKKLNFRTGDTVDGYNSKMLGVLNPLLNQEVGAVKIACSTEKLFVDGVEKDCVWEPVDKTKPDGQKVITCNRAIFIGKKAAKPNESLQMHDVHHELAGIAGLEANRSNNSGYFYTDQLSAHAKWVLHYELVVEDVSPNLLYTSYEANYSLQTASAMAKGVGLEKIAVRKLLGSETDYILSIDGGLYDVNQQGGVVARYFSETNKTTFDSGNFNSCDDFGCAGVSSIKGEFVLGQDFFEQTISVVVSFFKDNDHGGVKEWKEKLIFKRDR